MDAYVERYLRTGERRIIGIVSRFYDHGNRNGRTVAENPNPDLLFALIVLI